MSLAATLALILTVNGASVTGLLILAFRSQSSLREKDEAHAEERRHIIDLLAARNTTEVAILTKGDRPRPTPRPLVGAPDDYKGPIVPMGM